MRSRALSRAQREACDRAPWQPEVKTASLERGTALPRKTDTGAIAQLGERVLCKHEVVGSIPSGSTIHFVHGSASRHYGLFVLGSVDPAGKRVGSSIRLALSPVGCLSGMFGALPAIAYMSGIFVARPPIGCLSANT